MSTDEIWAGEDLQYKLKLTNAGKTPAHILNLELTVGERTEVRDSGFWMAAGESKEIQEPVDINRAIDDLITAAFNEGTPSAGAVRKKATIPVDGLVKYRNIFSQGQVVETTSFHYRYSGIDEKMLILPPDKQAEDEGDDEPHTA